MNPVSLYYWTATIAQLMVIAIMAASVVYAVVTCIIEAKRERTK